MDESDLINLIHEAFSHVEHPADTSLLHPEGSDDHDIRPFYGVEHWQGVTGWDLAYHNAALCFFSPSAFQFFLPAFLIWVIQNYRRTDAFTVDSTIYALDVGTPPDPSKVFRLRALSAPQREAVVAFLRFMSTVGDRWCDTEAARNALQRVAHDL